MVFDSSYWSEDNVTREDKNGSQTYWLKCGKIRILSYLNVNHKWQTILSGMSENMALIRMIIIPVCPVKHHILSQLALFSRYSLPKQYNRLLSWNCQVNSDISINTHTPKFEWWISDLCNFIGNKVDRHKQLISHFLFYLKIYRVFCSSISV